MSKPERKASGPGWDGVVIRRFIQMVDALIFQSFFNSRGIMVYLLDDHAAPLLGMSHYGLGGMGVLIPKSQLVKVKKAMAEFDLNKTIT